MKLTWFAGSTIRIHIGGRILVADPAGISGVDAGELVSGADATFFIDEAGEAVDPALWQPILGGGEDYEVLCAVPSADAAAFAAAALAAHVPCADIGTIVAGDAAPVFLTAEGTPLAITHPGHDHFAGG